MDLGYEVKISKGEVMVALCGSGTFWDKIFYGLDSRTQASCKQSQQPL